MNYDHHDVDSRPCFTATFSKSGKVKSSEDIWTGKVFAINEVIVSFLCFFSTVFTPEII